MKTIFKLRNRAITLLGVALSVAGCSGSGGHSIDPTPTPTPTPTPGGEIAVTSVTISTGKGYLEKGGTLALEAEVKPANATNKTITWSSTNTSVATVTSDGIISAKAAGTTTIKATAGGKSASCTVTVLDAAIDLSLMDIYGNTVSRTTANCYVVSKPGFYKIPMVYGNAIKNGATNRDAYVSLATGTSILTNFLDHKGAGIGTGNDAKDPWVSQKYSISKTGLIWQDSENLVEGIAMTGNGGTKENKYVTFYLDKANFTQGNAIVAAYDAEGLVAWSWHIWVTDVDLTPIPVKNVSRTFNFLPVCLGWCEPKSDKSKNGDVYGNCVLYQWGRKDPMLGSKGSGGNTNKGYYGPKGFIDGSFTSKSLKDDIKAYIQNPGSFNMSQNMDNKYSNLWSANATPGNYLVSYPEKTVYDPSPAGFTVPPAVSFTGFTKDGNWTNELDNINSTESFKLGEGYYFYTEGWKTGELIHFPGVGGRTYSAGSYFDAGVAGWCWFATCRDDVVPYMMAYFKRTSGPDTVGPLMGGSKGNANIVIPCQEP